jgi:hypothetical protein
MNIVSTLMLMLRITAEIVYAILQSMEGQAVIFFFQRADCKHEEHLFCHYFLNVI